MREAVTWRGVEGKRYGEGSRAKLRRARVAGRDRWVLPYGAEFLGAMAGKKRVERRSDEKVCVLFVRVREDIDSELEAWVTELRASGEVWKYVGKADLVRDILQAALRARREGV